MNNTKRLFAFLCDTFFLINLCLLPIILLLDSVIKESSLFNSIIGVFGWSIIMMKDSFNGSSVFKMLFGFTIVSKEGQRVSTLEAVLRNSTLILLTPIEVLFLIFRSKRIGERLTKTQVIETTPLTLKETINSIKKLDFRIDLFIAWGIAIILSYLNLKLYDLIFSLILP